MTSFRFNEIINHRLFVDSKHKLKLNIANSPPLDIDEYNCTKKPKSIPAGAYAVQSDEVKTATQNYINPVKFFFDGSFTNQQKKAILEEKLAKTPDPNKTQTRGYLSSFVSDSLFRTDGSPKRIKVLGFCYPKQALSKDELKAFFAVNLMALVHESKETHHQIPFIIPYPPSHLLGNDSKIKIFFEALSETYQAYAPLVIKHIGDFIVQFPATEIARVKSKYIDIKFLPIKLKLADFDLLSLADNFADCNIQIPLPINGDFQRLPGHNQDPTASDFDTSLARSTLNIHGIAVKHSAQNLITKFDNPLISAELVHDTSGGATGQSSSESQTHRTLTNSHFYSIPSPKSSGLGFSSLKRFTGRSPNASPKTSLDRESKQFSLRSNNLDQLNEQAHFVFFVEQAVQDLDHLKDFRTNTTHANNLLQIMSFAKENNGVSRKKDELQKKFSNSQLVNQACEFSYRFQKLMIEYGNVEDAYGRRPRSRLFRNIKLKNVEALFANLDYDRDIYNNLTSSLKQGNTSRLSSLTQLFR